MKREGPPGSAPVQGRLVRPGGGDAPLAWLAAEEVPVGIQLNSVSVAVMMATPADLEEMAIGFLVAEGHVAPGAVTAALVLPTEGGHCVDVAAPGVEARPPDRAVEGRSGCGLCGMRDLTDLGADPPFRARPALDADAVAQAFEALGHQQPIRAANRSVHAAGFFVPGEGLVIAREDVGRHTALDKTIGALALRGLDPATGIAVMTSRCSFELVRKAALAGLGGLATRSAPTALAVALARRAGLPLACRAAGGIALF